MQYLWGWSHVDNKIEGIYHIVMCDQTLNLGLAVGAMSTETITI
jgi:hypothetical protein